MTASTPRSSDDARGPARAFAALALPRVRERIRQAEERVRIGGGADLTGSMSADELGSVIADLRSGTPVEDPER
jgi:hypothetical protein